MRPHLHLEAFGREVLCDNLWRLSIHASTVLYSHFCNYKFSLSEVSCALAGSSSSRTCLSFTTWQFGCVFRQEFVREFFWFRKYLKMRSHVFNIDVVGHAKKEDHNFHLIQSQLSEGGEDASDCDTTITRSRRDRSSSNPMLVVAWTNAEWCNPDVNIALWKLV